MLTLDRFLEILEKCKKDFREGEDLVVGITKTGVLSIRSVNFSPKSTSFSKIIFLDYYKD